MNLSEIQNIIQETEKERGHDKDTIIYKIFLLMEELGELCKSIRVSLNYAIHGNTEKYNLEDEFGDVQFLLGAAANRLGIDLEKALLNKIEKDKKKVYKRADDWNEN